MFESGILDYTLNQINSDLIQGDFYLQLFLINDIDTNLISIFVPEIWDYPQSQFVTRDKNGHMEMNNPSPCEINLAAHKQPPSIRFTEAYQLFQSQLKVTINCRNKTGHMAKVVTIHSSTNVQFKFEI